MTRDEFWQLIDASRDSGGETFETAENLREALEKRPLGDILEYLLQQEQVMEESYTLALRGAVYLAHGGCTDDQFEAFRGWLLAQGREVFERVVADPDALVDVFPEDDKAESEQMLYVGALAHEAATGEFPEGPTFHAPDLGARFDFDDALQMKPRYPRLWERFEFTPRASASSSDAD